MNTVICDIAFTNPLTPALAVLISFFFNQTMRHNLLYKTLPSYFTEAKFPATCFQFTISQNLLLLSYQAHTGPPHFASFKFPATSFQLTISQIALT